MILGIGMDAVAIDRMALFYHHYGERGLKRLFTPSEQSKGLSLKSPMAFFAKRFAGKEAAMKALQTGLSQGVSWQDFSIENNETGAPILQVKGRAQEIAQEVLWKKWGENYGLFWHISLSDTKDTAYAHVILEGIPL
jgi:holo-[acyl-carrier protein] synthase